jgi:hypothetical protein
MIPGTTSAVSWRDHGKPGKFSYIFIGIVEGTSHISLINNTTDIFPKV